MTETAQFTIGSEASCGDGVCGKLTRVVVDPVGSVLTHLVVEPSVDRGTGRMVPIDLADSEGGEIRLRCTMAEFEALESAQETQFLPGAPGDWAYEQSHMLSWPYYGMGMGGGVLAGGGIGPLGANPEPGAQEVRFDRIPVGEVDVRRGEHVHATDGDIGRVQGLVVDPQDHRVTHVLLQEGHLWGRKEVAIPIGSVTGVKGGVRLNLSKNQVRDLPPVDVGAAG